MGLRERRAAETRKSVTEAAIRLFEQHGYPDTTMEAIAADAEISASTLYRYFGTKPALVIEAFELHGQMAEAVASRPADESLADVLGHALRAALTAPTLDSAMLARIRTIIERDPALQGPLQERLQHERLQLQHALANRLDVSPHDIGCDMSARMTVAVLEMTSEVQQRDGTNRSLEDVAADVLRGLNSTHLVIPRLP